MEPTRRLRVKLTWSCRVDGPLTLQEKFFQLLETTEPTESPTWERVPLAVAIIPDPKCVILEEREAKEAEEKKSPGKRTSI
ncbi:hypothetical protein CEXT_454961 [Caerostris extrusa]|uniref:Uncharacterized protein n=1 Tax=Caerostris extrusa TaxID=172846 RepID=A0AAV4MXI0_CAEEX|nr:hypothetical protein CEXT_454961 [Caerostris extrusa]